MITINGFPKSGLHALVKAVQLLGQPAQVDHIPYGNPVEAKHIFIKRDPRNVVCSWLRFQGMPVTPGMFITAFRKFQELSLIEEIAPFEGWLTDPNTHILRFEDLLASAAAMQDIALYLGVPYIPGAWEDLPGLTVTWFPDHSDFNTIWTQEVQDVWAAEGGPALLTRWGY